MYPLWQVPRRFTSVLFVLLAAFFAAARLSATTYYVDYSAGSDSSSGLSSSAAWKHCPGDPSASSLPASTSLVSGDTVVFKGGVTYVLTGATGIALKWNGSSSAPITYDGNSAGTWGAGRARITDNHGGNNLAAFTATSAADSLTFTSLEFTAIGGSAALPVDTGVPAAPRGGSGIVFKAGVSNATITGCVFSDLGYWFNQRPMAASSITGNAIEFKSCNNLSITSCDFSKLNAAIEMSQATTLSNLTITDCSFHDSVVWTIDLPAPSVTPSNLVVSGCTESVNAQFTAAQWLGYGSSPRTLACNVNAGDSVTLGVSAAASPAASFTWQKNGTTIAGATGSKLTIAAATSADAGTYTVYAVNSAGSTTSNDAVVTVASSGTPASNAQAPVITTQPVNQTGAPWGTATFTVAASGTPAPTYQWLKNGSPISGWTNATLTLIALTTNDNATYTAVATNSAGSATSNPATLTVSSSSTPSTPTAVTPAITTQPTSAIVAAGASASFSVTASGTPAPTFQWSKDGTPIAGATNATLTLTSVSSANSGTYTVVASNSAGSATSNAATLTVTTPTTVAPVITTQPVNQTGAPWGTATFTVAASGTPAPTYQWCKNGTPISGWTNATLTLIALSTNDTATYTAVATNSAGSVTSNPATLTVTSSSTPPPPTAVAPVITTQPVSQTGTQGSTATFTVAASGTPAPTYQWYKNGTPISGWTSATLTLVALTTNDTATYKAVATNSAGSATSNPATLTVTSSSTPPPPTAVAPVITTQPVSQTGTQGNTATFTVAASGTPAPTYQWYKNGKPISGWTSATLTLVALTVNDNATYTAVATNSAGSATSNPATLTVTSSTTPTGTAPVITKQPVSQTAYRLSNVSFTVAASGTPAPTYQWLKNGKPMAGRTGPTLTLSAVTSNDNATYSAVATNSAGTVTSNGATLNVVRNRFAASAEGATTDLPLDSHIANLSVRAMAGTEPLIVGFVVTGDDSKSLLVRGVGPTLSGYGVEGALPDPKLSLYSGRSLLDSNSRWDSAANAATVAQTSHDVGAFALPATSGDAALLSTLPAGAYTAHVTSSSADRGLTLVELYDASQNSNSRMINVSVRANVSDGAGSPIIGFVVTGTEPKKILVRAVGPGLNEFGVDGTIADPKIEILRDGKRVAENDNWSGDVDVSDAAVQVGAFALKDPNSKDAALIFVAEPGAYSAVVTGVGGASGAAILEVYEIE